MCAPIELRLSLINRLLPDEQIVEIVTLKRYVQSSELYVELSKEQ